MAGITVAGNAHTVQAASANSAAVKKVVIVEGNTLGDCLEQLEKEQKGNCAVIMIPCIPGLEGDRPEAPDTNVPDTPDTNVPETPDTNVPETPDTEKPGNADTNQPGQDDVISSEHAYVLRIAELVNEARANAGLKPLTLDKNITRAAQVRAVETEKSFSHTRPDGRHFSTALGEAGVSYRGAGENIAWGQKTPEQVMDGWMNSPGHRANILNENFTSIGVGYYQNSNGVNYWSQLFTY